MADLDQYLLTYDGGSYPVTDVTFGPTLDANAAGDPGSFISFFSSGYVDFDPELSSFTISDFVDGVDVGSVAVSGVTAAYSFEVSHTPLTNYGDGALALNLCVNGEFNQGQPCFVGGTLISTPSGDREVSTIRVGDNVTLVTGLSAKVVWIGHRRSRGTTEDAPVVFCPNALGSSTPTRELRVSPDHAIFIDGVLVPAALLVNGSTIFTADPGLVQYYHIELQEHGVILAEGAAAESYLDSGNRRQFSNCPFAYDPVKAKFNEPCAEIVFAGEHLKRITSALNDLLPASLVPSG